MNSYLVSLIETHLIMLNTSHQNLARSLIFELY